MISVTRLDGSEFIINSDLIETIEATPDTVITFAHDKKVIVNEAKETPASRSPDSRVGLKHLSDVRRRRSA